MQPSTPCAIRRHPLALDKESAGRYSNLEGIGTGGADFMANGVDLTGQVTLF
jgi:hypothetical protein